MRYGFFDDAHREYVIDRVDCPQPMTNYLGVQRMGAVVSHQAGGYCWLDSPEYHRITRFRANSMPTDGPGHWVYVKDRDSGEFFSVSWQPVGTPMDRGRFRCRHGLSYSVYEAEVDGIAASQTLLIPIVKDPASDPVEIFDVRIRNCSDRPRNLSVFGYVEFSFHHIEFDNQNFQMSLYCSGSSYEDHSVICDLHYEEGAFQFFTSSLEPASFDGVREAFIGPYRTERNPYGVENGQLSSSTSLGGNPVGALENRISLLPGEEVRFFYYLGTGDKTRAAQARSYYTADRVDQAMEELRAFWDERLSTFQIRTPHENMNRSINIWNLYQSDINVLFSRFSSFIEVGGRTGLGYRDTAQDAMCIPGAEPGGCLLRLRQLLQGQVHAGYGLHLFDPAWFKKEKKKPDKSPTVVPTFEKSMIHGLEDACADDALWLIPAVCEYVMETGDHDFLNEVIPYADHDADPVFLHLKRSLDFSYGQIGQHGITLGLRADWNDCLNLGGGESAMVAFLLVWATDHFVQLCVHTGHSAEAEEYGARRDQMAELCRKVLWNGQWFLRGFTASGRPIGGLNDREGRVHMESNTWAVASGASTREQGLSCMDAVDEYLYTPYGLMLNAPSFTQRDDEIGFVTRVYPGIKENGAIFSHPNPWAWMAECMLGRGGRAMKFYDALLPENQNEIMEIRRAEPYTYCQFIMGRDHAAFGQARHPFMTGSSGWAYYAATHYMLGIRPFYDGLVVDPCIPAEWDGFEVKRVWRGTEYRIRVSNPDHVEKGVKTISLDGQTVDRIPIPSGGTHTVEVVMG